MKTANFTPGQVVGIHFAEHHVRKAVVYAVVEYATHIEYAVILLDDNSRENFTSNFIREWTETPAGFGSTKPSVSQNDIASAPKPVEKPMPPAESKPEPPEPDPFEIPTPKAAKTPAVNSLMSPPVQDIPELDGGSSMDDLPY